VVVAVAYGTDPPSSWYSRKLRGVLDIQDPTLKLGYQCHEDSMRSGQSYTNPDRFTL